MAFTNFCCRSGGSNLNAGTRTGDTTEPGTAADLTYASGNWVQSTRVFTVASGDPVADGVAVGDFVSVYADGSTVTGYVGRVSARTTTTITIASGAVAGTAPTDGTGTRTLKVGGAWKGPNAAEAFPFNFVTAALTNTSTERPRVNFKNDAQYDITAAISHSIAGPVYWRGYTSSYGDGGRATIDGGTSGASYVLLTINNVAGHIVEDFIFQNNGATGSAAGVVVGVFGAGHSCMVRRCVFHDLRGFGLSFTSIAGTLAVECEAYNCNQSNTTNTGGFGGIGNLFLRCIAHDNTGSNSAGFHMTSANCVNCIADTNTVGFRCSNNSSIHRLLNCDAYNNSDDGIQVSIGGGTVGFYFENCNLIKNGGYGIDLVDGTTSVSLIVNCGFGAGTQANTSGTINATTGTDLLEEVGRVTYADDVTPWVDPANGDFRINLAAAKGAGRGAFLQTASSYAGAVGYPDIGAAQHQDSGGSGGVIVPQHNYGVESILAH